MVIGHAEATVEGQGDGETVICKISAELWWWCWVAIWAGCRVVLVTGTSRTTSTHSFLMSRTSIGCNVGCCPICWSQCIPIIWFSRTRYLNHQWTESNAILHDHLVYLKDSRNANRNLLFTFSLFVSGRLLSMLRDHDELMRAIFRPDPDIL